MCFADRLSSPESWVNFTRLLISSLAYEMFLLLKAAIRKTPVKQAQQWCIDTIRARLLKVGATLEKTKRRIYYQLSSAFVYQDLFGLLITQQRLLHYAMVMGEVCPMINKGTKSHQILRKLRALTCQRPPKPRDSSLNEPPSSSNALAINIFRKMNNPG